MPRGVYDRTKKDENPADGTQPPADPPQDPPAGDDPAEPDQVDGELCGQCFPHGWSIPDTADGQHDTAQCQHGDWVR